MGKTPKEIRDVSSATAVHGNVIHSSTSTSNNESVGVLSEDISRIQSAIQHYSETRTYKLNDLITYPDIPLLVLINIIAITTPETFDLSKWKLIGVGSKLVSKGDLLSYNGSLPTSLGVGSNSQILSADNSKILGLNWINPALEEIGRVEVIANSSTIIVTLPKQKKNLFVKFLIIPTASMLAQMRFNNDETATVSELMVDNFTSVSSQVGDNDIQISDVSGESNPMAGTIDITNIPTQIKQGMVLKTGTNGTGALSIPTTKTNAFKWINTTVGINEIRFIVTSGAGLYGIGSYVIVYGFD